MPSRRQSCLLERYLHPHPRPPPPTPSPPAIASGGDARGPAAPRLAGCCLRAEGAKGKLSPPRGTARGAGGPSRGAGGGRRAPVKREGAQRSNYSTISSNSRLIVNCSSAPATSTERTAGGSSPAAPRSLLGA